MKVTMRMKPGVRIDNKVSCIKVWRTVSGLGLKEAKDAVEAVMDGKPQVFETTMTQDNPSFREAIRTLEAEGMVAALDSPVKAVVMRAVESSAKLALENGEYDLAIDLTQILKKHTERTVG